MTGVPVIRVDGPTPYDVSIGHGSLGLLGDVIAGAGAGRGDGAVAAVRTRAAVLHPPSVAAPAAMAGAVLRRVGVDVLDVPLPDAEAAKTAGVAAQVWDRLGNAGFTRSDWIIGVGGGATTDLAGFVAATWLRGVRFVAVPTTLLGMVDAAVGGKTGINIAAGKNLVGAFWEPAAVLCDLDLLAGLPATEYRTGMAEVVKCGFVADPVILDAIEADPDRAARFDPQLSAELIARSIAVKARVVAADLTETAATTAATTATAREDGSISREILNYGHTLGHAVERREQYRWRHGDAVAVGLVYAAELARAGGVLDDPTADRHRSVLDSLGLPTGYPADAWPDLLAGMRTDKKARGDLLRFVVLHGLADPAILAGPAPELLEGAYAAISR